MVRLPSAAASQGAVRLLAATLLLAFPLNAAQLLPEGFMKCPKSDAEFSKCMEKAIPIAMQQVAPGLPSFGLPPLDPLHIPQFSLGQTDGNSPVNLNITLTDIYIYGLKDSLATDVTSDLANYKMAARGNSPNIFVEADYVMNGKILVLPVVGSGHAHANITNLHAQVALEGEENIKNGKTYMKVIKFTTDIYEIEHMTLHFDNLFNGDKTLGDNTNAVLNDNWREFWGELRPPFEETLRYTFMEFARRIFNRVAYDAAFSS